MRFRFPLYAQIICVFLINLALLVGLRYAVFSSQFQVGWDSILYSPISERVQGIAFDVFKQFQTRPESQWTNVLNEYGDFYGVKLYLFDALGNQVAGDRVELPDPVMKKVTEKPFINHLSGPHGGGLIEVRRFLLAPGRSKDGPADHADYPEKNERFGSPPRFSGPLDQLLGRPHLPPPARLMVYTKNPDRFWIGGMFPMHWRRPVTIYGALPPDEFLPGTLIAATPNIWQTKLISDYGNLGLVILCIFVLSLALWWPFVFLLTRALGKLVLATERIAEGNFDTNLSVNRLDEIGRLAQAISVMSSRLKAYVGGQKRFLGDIAHELCSPIARLQIALEILEREGSKDQETCIRDIREEVQQMSLLINELLAFSKAGIQGRETALKGVEVECLIRSAVERSCAEHAGDIVIEADSGLGCLCDEVLLERALGNVLRNAIRYAGDAGPIGVDAYRVGDNVLIAVSDCGPGVPEDAIKSLGEPFYRPEESRNRNFGGVGLGLAIVKSCVEACHGVFKVENLQPHGLRVEMRLKVSEVGANAPPQTVSLP
jgi:two-component system sensor histidine kinase CpxA